MIKKQKKIYLVINSKEENENVIDKEGKEEIKAEVLEIVQKNSTEDKDLYVQIKSDKCIDDVIDIAEENGFNVINCGKTYILNKCFQDTAYALYGENISHEAINKFSADNNNKRYFFLCSNGKVNSKRLLNEDCIFTTNNKTERLFLLKNAQLISYSKYETGKKNKYTIIQRAKNLRLVAKNEEITYNGVNINNIFEENSFSRKSGMSGQDGSTNESDFPSVTFSGEEVKKPKTIGEKLFSYDDTGFEKLSRSSMRQFVFQGTSLYKKINELLGNDDWEDDSPIPLNKDCEEQDFVLGVIGKQERETYLSSLIAYAFKHSPSVLNEFLGENISVPYYVYREEKNVDILIRSKDKIIIIENKIEAGFSEGEKNWFDFISPKEKDVKKIEEVKLEKYTGKNSQLEKYYRLAKYYAMIQGLGDSAIKCYLLCPEYKKSFYKKHKQQYAAGDKYEVVSYGKLSKSLEKRENGLKEDKKRIIDDLKCAIKMYTYDQNTYYMEQACNRFIMKINQKKLDAQLIEV